MQTYICKCGKTFQKSTKAETTGYELHDFSPQHECYGCPYIVTEQDWKTNEVIKRECRATPKITYLSKCHIGTEKGDFTACKLYSLDLVFAQRVINYVKSLDGAETTGYGNCIPDKWRAADFGKCYSSDDCFGLAIFDLHFQNNKKGTEARKLVKERFFTATGVRKDMTEEKERETVLMRIQIAKENARKAFFLFEQYDEEFGRFCRFDKGGFEKIAAQHYDEAKKIYDKIVSQGLEQAYKKYREEKRKPTEEEETMARKLQLDAAITKDIRSAASDSFIDNIKMIDVADIVPSKENFYEMSNIELLADDIEREGLKTNLLVSKEKNGSKYLLKSGHRRFSAIKLLISEKRLTSTKVPCLVDGEKTKAESKLDLIMLNATQRKYSDAEVMSEYEQLSLILKELDSEGKGLGGRMRDNIAKILNISNGQVGKLDNIKHNAAPEVKKAVEDGKMSISTANEVAKLAPEKQKEVIEKKPDISSAEVKKMQDKKPAAPSKPSSTAPDEHFTRVTEFNPDAESDDWDNDDTDLDDDSIDDVREEDAAITSEKKSSLVLSLILSENEAKTLLRFFYRFDGNYGAVGAADTAELREIEAKLKTLCGK